MAFLKCKMCGGDLNIVEGETVAICEYCDTKQTVPTADNEKKMTLFARANRLRAANEFDKAAGIYESIVADFPEEAEAYWGLLLCKFGIEYVDDPATGKKIPTCHRSSFDSIMDDSYFEQVLENADAIARRVYREEAKAIEELRKNIIEVSSKEEPYDIFICYKETDENGDRTIDSVIAQDVYDTLTERGYRVFFSRITLEDKLGQEYEPYIFAALNSAKVMLAFGTDYEYYNAVWVKNEWSRFLALIAKGEKKTLIPCFKDIDAYDMPKEFRRLQAQNMGKVGAVQDLLRGIEKIIPRKKNEEPAQQNVFMQGGSKAVELLKRGMLALEEGEWNRAGDCCNRVLNSDAECADAYVGLLMAELHAHRRSDLADRALPFDGTDYFKNAVRCGDAKTKAELNGYITHINERNRNVIYESAVRGMQAAKTKKAFQEAARKFRTIPGWRDADYLAEQCLKKTETARANRTERNGAARDKAPGNVNDVKPEVVRKEDARAPKTIASPKAEDRRRGQYPENSEESRKDEIYYRAVNAMREANSEETYRSAVKLFRTVYGWRGANALAEQCFERAEEYRKEKIYNRATNAMQKALTKSACQSVADLFASIPGWRDANHQAEICKQMIREWTEKEEAKRLEAERTKKKDAKSIRRIIVVCSSVVALFIAFLIVFNTVIRPSLAISKAKELAGQHNYAGAEAALGDVDWQEAETLKKEYFKKYIKYSRKRIAGGRCHTVGLKADGTVVAVGDNGYGQCDVSEWKNIVEVFAGDFHTVGLKADGTMVAVGYNKDCQCNVGGWKNIVAISAGDRHTIGLKSDGTVVAVGNNNNGQCNVSDWKDIIAVFAGSGYTVGLKSDGTVVAEGDNIYSKCEVKEWEDIVAVSAGEDHTVGLKSDGTVVAVGDITYGQCNVEGWEDIAAISVGNRHTVGLKADDTVVAVGNNGYGQCNVNDWKDIVEVSASGWHTVGLKSDGTVVAVGDNFYAQCNVSDWKLWY